jgi:hypothetical protein
VRARAEVWTSRLAESVGHGAADAVVVALDMSIPQGRRLKKAVSVGINDKVTTPTRARLNELANVSPQCRNQITEMQRHFCSPLFLHEAKAGDGQAAEARLRKRVSRVRKEGNRNSMNFGFAVTLRQTEVKSEYRKKADKPDADYHQPGDATTFKSILSA